MAVHKLAVVSCLYAVSNGLASQPHLKRFSFAVLAQCFHFWSSGGEQSRQARWRVKGTCSISFFLASLLPSGVSCGLFRLVLAEMGADSRL